MSETSFDRCKCINLSFEVHEIQFQQEGMDKVDTPHGNSGRIGI